jgi:hypothetical protein
VNKDLEGAVYDVFQGTLQHLVRETEKNPEVIRIIGNPYKILNWYF